MIKIDIPMPDNCQDCPCMYDCIYCQAADRKLNFMTFTDERPEWCPLIKEEEMDRTKEPAQLMPRELLLHTWGHGWEESHMIGDDEDPESFDLVEVVWINGHIMTAEGSDANADSEYWKDRYNCTYGVRIWTGDEKPTEEQRKATPWMNHQ